MVSNNINDLDIIDINEQNIEKEHICCAISDKKGETCVKEKKDWLKERFKDGLVFKRINARGKVFIEYIPSEKAWIPIDAKNYMHINCFWVSGKFKGHGYANKLLNECILDSKSKGKIGLTILSSKTKKTFLSDPKYLKYKGFKVADTTNPYYELLYLNFDNSSVIPKFNDSVKNPKINLNGFILFFSNQCPHTEKYANIIKSIADSKNIKFTLKKISNLKDAQNAPAPFTTYSLFYNSNFITNEILSEKNFLKLLDKKVM